MTNENDKNYGGESKNTDTADHKKNPTHEGGQHLPNQQDSSKKAPSQTGDSRSRQDQGSEPAEKRRA